MKKVHVAWRWFRFAQVILAYAAMCVSFIEHLSYLLLIILPLSERKNVHFGHAFIWIVILSCRLDERKRRKDFVLERNLLYPNPIEKELSSEEKEIYNRCKVFMRFQTQDEHEAFVRGLIEEYRLRKRIQELQVGCLPNLEILWIWSLLLRAFFLVGLI